MDGETSDPLPVLSGVPQGSVIGPLLYLIYVDGIKTTSLSAESHLTLFADDMLLYRPIANAADFSSLQKDIDSISDWVDRNHVQFNVQQCKFMHITRRTNSIQPVPQLKFCGQPLESVCTYKYLGLLLSSDLFWSQPIKTICSKARKLLGLIYPTFLSILHP